MLDFVRLAQDHNISYVTSGHHKCSTGWVQTHCPLCTDGKHGFHLGFNLEKGNFNCWRCGPVKTLDVIKTVLKISRDLAFQVLEKHQIRSRKRVSAPKTRRRRVAPPPGMNPIEGPHRRYLRSRRFSRRDVRPWEVQGTRHLSGAWNWRVVYPIRNQAGNLVAWQGRSITEAFKPKYKITDDDDCLEDPKSFLYGIHKAQDNYVFVVEGAFDVWRMGEGAAGLLGSNWHAEQANILRGYHKRFIILDSTDPRAQKKAVKLAEWLSLFPGETEVIEELPSDPAGLSRREARQLRKKLIGD